ncbi:hypothetical protein NM688_g1998 [Phlebia brevispora]|uniref:Uncharacterized protein n=1 Tax=Phlebia brevispora TaxID=194682 RepID=A0ACC1TA45_9APHY|nr:hypothetical protein NM688_g1998 [Phlebia brevispora]
MPPPNFDPNDDDSDTWSMKSGSTGFAPSVATSATTVDWEMRSASRPPSVFSMTNSLRANAYRHEYGRGLNNYSEVYRLPADEEELDRLDKQHIMFMEVMGKYPPPMAEVLADDTPGESKTCVDLGCGSGSWILDVAHDFPHVSAVAVDLVPMQVLSEVDDINLGLQHFYGDFNVVHARLISSGETIPIDQNASAIAKWMHLAGQAVKQQGGEPDAANHLLEWISTQGAFEDVVYRHWWFQTSPWNPGQDPDSRRANRHGALMRDDILSFLKSGRPLLLGTGIPEHIVNDYEDAARRELLEGKAPGFILVENVYARRKRS